MSNSSSPINILSSPSTSLLPSSPIGGSPTLAMSSPTPSLMLTSSLMNSSVPTTPTSSTTSATVPVTPTTTTSSSFTSSPSSTTTSTTTFTPTPTTSSTSTTTASPTTTSTTTSTSVTTPTVAPQPTSTSITTITEPRSTPTTTPTSSTTSSSSTSATSTNPAGLQVSSSNNGGGGLSSAGTTAIAVVIPVVVVAILVALGIFFWRKRKQRKNAREERRKEVEEYGYNPNDDPTLPAVGGGVIGQESPEMSEENGYRGWGNATNGTAATTRKASTNLSSGIGMAVSDEGNLRNRSPGSPGTHPSEGGLSNEPLMDGTNAGAVGGAAAAGAGAGTAGFVANRAVHGSGINRGPSNASSTYSAAGHTDDSGDLIGVGQDLTYDSNYSQYQPYNPGAGNYGAETQSPIIRDVSARRNTKIENAVYPQPGNSGIAQNF